jgi:hypothetical protein
MNLLEIGTAAAIVDFSTIVLSKFFNMGKSLDKWYSKFGMTAVVSDVVLMVLGVQLAMFFWPNIGVIYTAVIAVCIQIMHDLLFYFFVIETLPVGQNEMIDLFKEYANENSWKIVVYDSAMIASIVFLAEFLYKLPESTVQFIGLLTVYALTYIVYTK